MLHYEEVWLFVCLIICWEPVKWQILTLETACDFKVAQFVGPPMLPALPTFWSGSGLGGYTSFVCYYISLLQEILIHKSIA